jgi:ABC-2 type transport system permease protein
VLPVLSIAALEKIAFGTSHFVAMLGNRMSGGSEGDVFGKGGMSMTHLSSGHFLSTPGLWIGLAFAAAFIAAAVRLRRNREPI